ncbi:MAG: metal-dependent transcriptional regulator [Akkermansiaceae bacterium]|nr:metal-dependent transcriptional regulator [Akkermansia sp.]MCD7797851.1 metal-dependent transcriptional regulator [Akkermansiaceae bacterium]MCD8070145.1 metal-dependent transcriptional regulator [Akkermansiaceae bacterium]
MDNARLSQSAEDYLEAISNLSKGIGAALISEIAAELGVKKPSVTAAVRLLARQGLVEYTPYSPVRLTEQGKKIASRTIRSHHTLRHFLENVIGLPEERADRAACEIEHILEPEEIDRIGRLSEALQSRQCRCASNLGANSVPCCDGDEHCGQQIPN